jgi:acyl-homoserine lactone acylase PvdQ
LRLARRAVLAALLFSPALHAAPYHPQKGTEILWDKYGVPHIYAKSSPDLFFCYGYAQAEAHGNLLLRLYGESRGRAAEYFASPVTGDAKAETDADIKSDTWVLTNSIPQQSEAWLKLQTPEFRGYLEAFAAGINAYAAKHPDKLSPEAKRVLPITALDPIEHALHFVHYTFVASARMAEPTRRGAAVVSADAALTAGPLDAILPGDASFGMPADSDGGSNAWAIAPSHSTSGHSMLLSNPHLAWAGQTTYFEAEFNAPGVHIYGATQVGLPVLRFAFNDFLGYTHTVNGIGAKTLYRIKTSGDGYLYDGKVLPFETSTAAFKVRQPDGSFTTQTLNIRRTIQGPIIKEEDGDPIALRVAGLDRPYMLEQYWQMSNAHNFTQFETAIKRLQPPTYNVIYADRDGHIEYLFGGLLPRHKSGDVAYWAGIVPGDTSDTLWTDYHSYDELPKFIDPPSGHVSNTNEPPWDAAWPNDLDPKKFPAYTAPNGISFRAERSLHMLDNSLPEPFIPPPPPKTMVVGLGTRTSLPISASGEVEEGLVKKIGNGVSAPKLLYRPALVYKEERKKGKDLDKALVDLHVAYNGQPTHIRVISNIDEGLKEKIVEVVGKAIFTPAIEDGKPVTVETDLAISLLQNLKLNPLEVPRDAHAFSFDQLVEKKLSTRVEMADRILPDLLAAADKYGTPQAKEAAAVLAKWDRLNEADSRGAVLFYAWARQFMGQALTSQAGFAVPYALGSPMTTPRGLKDPAKAAAQLDTAASETMKDFGALDVPWGKVMRFQVNNQSGGATTGPSAVRTAPIDGTDLPGNGGYGNTGVFRVVTYGPLDPATKTRTPVHGDGYVALIEFSTPIHAKMSLSYGDSSQPNSSFHTNQLQLMEDKKMRDALLTRKDVEANLSSKETF